MPEPLVTQLLSIPSTLDELANVDLALEKFARAMGFPDDACADLGICVTEAVSNAILHAHHENPGIHVDVSFARFPEFLRVEVRDHGPGFNSRELPDPTLPENLLKVSGRGVHLIRALMDQVEIENLPDGMRVIMIKNLRK